MLTSIYFALFLRHLYIKVNKIYTYNRFALFFEKYSPLIEDIKFDQIQMDY